MINKSDIDINIEILDLNKLIIKCNEIENFQYAYYIYKNDECIDKISYSNRAEMTYWLTLPGNYRVSVFLKKDSNKIRQESNIVEYLQEGIISNSLQNNNKQGLFYKIKNIFLEIITNLVLALRMSKFDYQLENKDTYLGKIWSVLTPLIQIGTYWLVFGVGIRQGKDVDGYPFVIWMICGLIPWFFINSGIIQGANSILKKASILTRMRFPLATVPVSTIFVSGFEHIMMLIIMVFMFACMGYYPQLSWLNLLYYIFYMIVFLICLSLITSVLTVIVRDFFKLLQSMMRLLFYVTPVLWTMNTMPDIYQSLMRFNPIYYIIKGFRNSILYGINFYNDWESIVFFWLLNIILFAIGAHLQVKFRNRFIDLI